jgi:hypothetical protein
LFKEPVSPNNNWPREPVVPGTGFLIDTLTRNLRKLILSCQ